MSPVLILSRLCLKRRFQFLGISDTSSRSTSRTFFTVSSSITRRRPASAAFSVGTLTVMSLWRILIEVLAPFAEHLHLLLLQHLPRAVMRVDHVIADLELDVLDLTRRFQLLIHCFLHCLWRNDILLSRGRLWAACGLQVCR